MKLVEPDSPGPDGIDEGEEVTTPPRPERRRVSVSLLLTVSVLIGTVVAVYAIFPARHNLLLTRTAASHRTPPAFQLHNPTQTQLDAWSMALLDRDVPWPEIAPPGEILGAAPMSLLNRPAALVRYRVDGDEISLLVQRARDAVPRKHRRTENGVHVTSWRVGPWTFVAAGDQQRASAWRSVIGAP